MFMTKEKKILIYTYTQFFFSVSTFFFTSVTFCKKWEVMSCDWRVESPWEFSVEDNGDRFKIKVESHEQILIRYTHTYVCQ